MRGSCLHITDNVMADKILFQSFQFCQGYYQDVSIEIPWNTCVADNYSQDM